MINKLKEILRKRKTTQLRNDLRKTISESEKIREADINSIQTTWESLKQAGIHKYDKFYNVCLYSSSVNQDISILWNNYTLTESKSEKNLYGRLLSMTIIEFLDDINGLLGKNLRIELISNDMEEFVVVLNKINKSYSNLKTQNNSELRKIRNNAAAHKTKIAKDLIDFADKIHYEKLDKIAALTSEINIILNQLSTEVIKKITKQVEQRNY